MKKLLLPLAGMLLGSAATPGSAAIRLNEVNLNPPSPDENFEFIELKSTTNGVEACTGLSIIIINNDRFDEEDNVAKNIGVVEEVWDLNDLSTGSNGLLLLGNGYASAPRGGPWAGFVDPATAVGDPSGMGDSDIKSNDGLSILLVSGFNNQTVVKKGDDLDVDNNGILDITPLPFTIVDSIGTKDFDSGTNPYVTTAANIFEIWKNSLLGDRDPDTFARRLGDDGANSAAFWYGGKLTDGPGSTVTYVPNRFFGPLSGSPQVALFGEVTPGRPNLSQSLQATDFRINEVGLNPVGTNVVDRFQFIEIINTGTASNPAPTARSLQGFWLVLIDSFDGGNDENPGGGEILEKWDLSGMSTGPNGLLLIGDGFSSAYSSFKDLVSTQTALGSPTSRATPLPASTGFSEGDIRFKDGLTLLLVKNFINPADPDFDKGDGLGGPDDGQIDPGRSLAQMGTIMDQVGFTQVGKTALGRTYSTVDLRTVMPPTLSPDLIARKPGDKSVATTAWYGGSFTNNTSPTNLGLDVQKVNGEDRFFGGFRGAATPGLPNLSATINPTTPPVQASIRINEVMINPTDFSNIVADDNREYIELVSSNGGIAYLDGLWVFIVDLENDGSSGDIVDSFPLDGLNTGLNGIVVAGDSWDNAGGRPYNFAEAGTLPEDTNVFDPPEGLGGDDLPNNGVAVLLVRNPIIGPVLHQTGLVITGDLDPDDDGTLLIPSAYCGEMLDSISSSTRNPGASYAWIDSTAFEADHVARFTGHFEANTKEAWQWGQIQNTPAAIPSIEYTGEFGAGALGTPFRAAASPGRPNHTAPLSSTGSVLLNEVNLNPPGADKNFEFVELINTGGTARSLNNFTLVVIDNVGPNTGTIRHAWSLDGMSTGSNGLLLIGNRYPLGKANDPDKNNPFFGLMAAGTATGDPTGREGLVTSFSDGVLGGDTDNLNFNLLLVRDFVGHIGMDLDEKVGAGGNGAADSPGDGVFDEIAFGSLADSIMFRDQPVPPDVSIIKPPWDGWAYDSFADLGTMYLSTNYYHPESFARFKGENASNSPSAWYGGDLNGGATGNNGDSLQYETAIATNQPFPAGFTGSVTPGQPNLSRQVEQDPLGDPDNDSVVTMLEKAFGTNPNAAENPPVLPTTGTVNVGGSNFNTISYRRLTGGTNPTGNGYIAEGFTYTVQSSTDLQTWFTDKVEHVSTTPPAGTTETATFRSTAAISPLQERVWLRLKVTKATPP